MHSNPSRWAAEALAKNQPLSCFAFFDRFTRVVGLLPTECLLTWRMALAKDLLHRNDIAIATVAERLGYGSASTFSTLSADMSVNHRGVMPVGK